MSKKFKSQYLKTSLGTQFEKNIQDTVSKLCRRGPDPTAKDSTADLYLPTTFYKMWTLRRKIKNEKSALLKFRRRVRI